LGAPKRTPRGARPFPFVYHPSESAFRECVIPRPVYGGPQNGGTCPRVGSQLSAKGTPGLQILRGAGPVVLGKVLRVLGVVPGAGTRAPEAPASQTEVKGQMPCHGGRQRVLVANPQVLHVPPDGLPHLRPQGGLQPPQVRLDRSTPSEAVVFQKDLKGAGE